MNSDKKMRTFGLIGGTSWHSAVEYYRNINQTVNEYFGDNTKAASDYILMTNDEKRYYNEQ